MVVMVVDGRGCVVRRDGGGGRRVVGHGPAGGGGGRGLDVLLRLPGGVHNVVLILIVERVDTDSILSTPKNQPLIDLSSNNFAESYVSTV